LFYFPSNKAAPIKEKVLMKKENISNPIRCMTSPGDRSKRRRVAPPDCYIISSLVRHNHITREECYPIWEPTSAL
jgi:hypothetical protein